MPEEQFLLLSLVSSIFKAFLKKQGVATTPNRLTYDLAIYTIPCPPKIWDATRTGKLYLETETAFSGC
jgi:hypothetical protein